MENPADVEKKEAPIKGASPNHTLPDLAVADLTAPDRTKPDRSSARHDDTYSVPLSSDGGILRRGNLVVTPCVTDDLLAVSYLNYKNEGTLPVIFYQQIPTLKDFIDAHLEVGKRIVLGCFRVDDATGKVEFCGLGWISDAVRMNEYCKAETGIGMFRCAGRDNLAFGKMMLESFFQQHNIDVIFGTTPEKNRLALRYAQKLGFDLSSPIEDFCTWEGELVAGIISHLSKKQWQERNRP